MIENQVNYMYKLFSNICEIQLMLIILVILCSFVVYCVFKLDLNFFIVFILLNELMSFNFKLKLIY